ncbi:hypothetical protein P7C70_g5639, partial [Phenoliferia sp. Uapishka_3]
MRFGTQNIRYDGNFRQPVPIPPSGDGASRGGAKGEMPWAERRSKIADSVLWENLDVVGFQEALKNQVEDLATLLGSEYSWVGVGRDDGKEAGEFVPVFYKASRLAIISTRHFWLSTTPNVPGSKSWDAGQTRMVTLVHFRPQTTPIKPSSTPDDFWILNTHWDDRGIESRTQAAKVILSEVNSLLAKEGDDGMAGKLVVLMGDLNSPVNEEGYKTLTGNKYPSSTFTVPLSPFRPPQTIFLDARHEVALAGPGKSQEGTPLLHAPFGEVEGTFTGFDRVPQKQVIDFIFFLDNSVVGTGDGSKWRVVRFGVMPNQYWDGRGNMYLSDHRMVVVRLEWTGL